MAQESAAYWRVRDKGRHLWATWGRQLTVPGSRAVGGGGRQLTVPGSRAVGGGGGGGSAEQPLDPIVALLADPEPDLDPPMSDDAGSLKYN